MVAAGRASGYPLAVANTSPVPVVTAVAARPSTSPAAAAAAALAARTRARLGWAGEGSGGGWGGEFPLATLGPRPAARSRPDPPLGRPIRSPAGGSPGGGGGR